MLEMGMKTNYVFLTINHNTRGVFSKIDGAFQRPEPPARENLSRVSEGGPLRCLFSASR